MPEFLFVLISCNELVIFPDSFTPRFPFYFMYNSVFRVLHRFTDLSIAIRNQLCNETIFYSLYRLENSEANQSNVNLD